MPFRTIKGIKLFIDPKTKKVGVNTSGHFLFSEDEFDKLFNQQQEISKQLHDRVINKKIPLQDPRNKELIFKNSEIREKVDIKRRDVSDEKITFFENPKIFAEFI